MDATVEDVAKRVGLTPREMADALASYVRSILSGNSRFDRYMDGELYGVSLRSDAYR